jgi:hypothetical protein
MNKPKSCNVFVVLPYLRELAKDALHWHLQVKELALGMAL